MSARELRDSGSSGGGDYTETLDTIPASDAGPNETMVFSIVPQDGNGQQVGTPFTPKYYPDRFNKVMEKELRKDGQQCKGQDVSIKNFKNAKLHATGVCLAREVSTLESLHAHDGVVDLYTPISPNGGIEAYLEKVELGEMAGYNPEFDEWMFNYTLDLISTGSDEYGSDGESAIVSSLLKTSPTDADTGGAPNGEVQ